MPYEEREIGRRGRSKGDWTLLANGWATGGDVVDGKEEATG